MRPRKLESSHHVNLMEHAPGSGFHPCDGNVNFFLVVWDLLGAKKVDPERCVPCGSYELLDW